MTPIQRLIRTRLDDLDRSYRAAADLSGGLVSHSYIQGLAVGKQSPDRVGSKIINGLALGLDVSVSKVREVVMASTGQTTETKFELPQRAESLTPRERKSVLAYIDLLLANRKLNYE